MSSRLVSRRTFLKGSALAAAAALSPRSWSQVVGSNSQARIAVMGLNGRGKTHLAQLAKVKGARVVALCDPDSALLEKGVAALGGGVKGYRDLRELFASNEVDAVTIATPNHWHALAAIWAMQAGKDVYVEKPVSHNIWEGRQLVAAAARYNRIVQAGTQIRSGEGLREAVEWVRAGNLGPIKVSRGFCYKRRDSIGKTSGPAQVPASIDYDLWSGPAPIVTPHRNSKKNGPVHYDWHWIYLYGNGDLGNQGIHQMDVARWFLGEPGLPRHTLSVGGRLGYDDDGDTPNTQVIVHDYPTAPLVFEVRGLPRKLGAGRPAGAGADAGSAEASGMDSYRGVSIGNVVDCEGGYLATGEYFSATAYDRDGKEVRRFKGEDRHMQNFVDVLHSRKAESLFGPVGEAHVSSALCHLGNISYQLGRKADAAEIRERIAGDALLSEAEGRMMEHLAANQVDLTRTPATLGVPLSVDTSAERFTGEGSDVANTMLTRKYRAPYVVPQLA
jgi:predicted dehydrogenase